MDSVVNVDFIQADDALFGHRVHHASAPNGTHPHGHIIPAQVPVYNRLKDHRVAFFNKVDTHMHARTHTHTSLSFATRLR